MYNPLTHINIAFKTHAGLWPEDTFWCGTCDVSCAKRSQSACIPKHQASMTTVVWCSQQDGVQVSAFSVCSKCKNVLLACSEQHKQPRWRWWSTMRPMLQLRGLLNAQESTTWNLIHWGTSTVAKFNNSECAMLASDWCSDDSLLRSNHNFSWPHRHGWESHKRCPTLLYKKLNPVCW